MTQFPFNQSPPFSWLTKELGSSLSSSSSWSSSSKGFLQKTTFGTHWSRAGLLLHHLVVRSVGWLFVTMPKITKCTQKKWLLTAPLVITSKVKAFSRPEHIRKKRNNWSIHQLWHWIWPLVIILLFWKFGCLTVTLSNILILSFSVLETSSAPACEWIMIKLPKT